MQARTLRNIICVSITLTLSFLVFTCAGYALKTVEPSLEKQQDIKIKTVNLKGLLESMEYLSDEIVLRQEILQSPDGKGKEELLRAQIDALYRKIIKFEESFDFLATEVHFRTIANNAQGDFNWSEELKTLLGPLIRELQRLTLRPRQIEKLRSDIELFEEQLETTQRALENIDLLTESTLQPRLHEHLMNSHSLWSNRKNEIETLKNIATVQLENKMGGDEFISQSVKKVPVVFFNSHGKHMLIAVFAMAFSAFVLFRLHGVIRKYSPMHAEDRSIYIRVFDLSYLLISVLFSLSISLGVLYYFSDWVLLSLALIFILGILWASKETLPRMWNQMRLILNLGPVREGELVVYKGLPYRVKTINIYTVIDNPVIECGQIKLPIADLLDLRSRPVMPDEPWFPTVKNDWVVFNDRTLGKVVSQTPETVKINLVGGGTVSYTASDFLSLSPMNLSSGFRLWIRFPIDFGHQDIITNELPGILEKDIMTGLREKGHGGSISDVNVYFMKVSDMSLDVGITADFFGKAGGDYFNLERMIQKICIDSCNKNKWIIPFIKLKSCIVEKK